MKEYHKIQSVFMRDPENNNKTFIMGEWSMPEFGYLATNDWLLTEKIDGTNIRVIWNPDTMKVMFSGKTDDAQLLSKLVFNLYEMFPIDLFEKVFPKTPVCLYGEGYGAGIGKGGKYRPDPGFILFDVKIGDWWLTRANVEDVATKLGIDTVPIIGTGTLWNAIDKTRDGFNSIFGNFIAEGIVARPVIDLFTRKGERIITKVKNRDFPK